jgi:serine phosphatase RsbU (regulator of sigma subunit)
MPNSNKMLQERKKIIFGFIISSAILVIVTLVSWYGISTIFLSIQRSEIAVNLEISLDRARLDELTYTRDLTEKASLTAKKQIDKVYKEVEVFHSTSPDNHTKTNEIVKLISLYKKGFDKNVQLHSGSTQAKELMVNAARKVASNAEALQGLQEKYINYDKTTLKTYRKKMFDILENASLSYELVIENEMIQNYEKSFYLFSNKRDIELASSRLKQMQRDIELLSSRIKNATSIALLRKIKILHKEYAKHIQNIKSLKKSKDFNSSELTDHLLHLQQNEKSLMSGMKAKVTDLEDLLVRRLELSEDVTHIMSFISDARQADRDYTLVKSHETKEIYSQLVFKLLNTALLKAKQISTMLIEDDEKEVFKSVMPDIKTYLNNFIKVTKILENANTVAKEMISTALKADKMLINVRKLRAIEKDAAIELSKYAAIGGLFFIFGIVVLIILIKQLLVKLDEARKGLVATNKHTRESIEYASLIQGALVPNNDTFTNYFHDYFAIWEPKDIVGGDIYLFEELRNGHESLLMVIDCTGHGVPGAFVTMLVKAIERQIIAKINNDLNIDVSPAWILSYFNKTMKKLLQQETQDSISNAGFDGGIIYYNRKKQILKFAGAETPLFYIDDEKLKTIKGNRHSIGYKKSDVHYDFKEHIINVQEGMKFYLTTDGYLDQNGGDKAFPFGKKRFSQVIKENSSKSFSKQKDILINTLQKYQANEERNDDVTLVGFEIKESLVFETIVEYSGVLTQGIIAHSIEVIESKVLHIGMMGKVTTAMIELTQNMMHYGKTEDVNSTSVTLEGFFEVTKDSQDTYTLRSENIVSLEDKDKIDSALREIESLDEAAIKKKYRDLRKSGENTHGKGGGIGFYEVAKLVKEIDYSFIKINEQRYLYKFKAQIASKKL